MSNRIKLKDRLKFWKKAEQKRHAPDMDAQYNKPYNKIMVYERFYEVENQINEWYIIEISRKYDLCHVWEYSQKQNNFTEQFMRYSDFKDLCKKHIRDDDSDNTQFQVNKKDEAWTVKSLQNIFDFQFTAKIIPYEYEDPKKVINEKGEYVGKQTTKKEPGKHLFQNRFNESKSKWTGFEDVTGDKIYDGDKVENVDGDTTVYDVVFNSETESYAIKTEKGLKNLGELKLVKV